MTDDLKARLLPCPFCGGKPEHTAIRDGRQVFCGGCHAGGPPAYRAPTGRPSALSRAITGWNNRPDADRIAELEAEVGRLTQDVANVTADYLRRHEDAVDHFEKWKISKARAARLWEAWAYARKTLPPDPSLNESWSQCIAIMDEACNGAALQEPAMPSNETPPPVAAGQRPTDGR